MPTTYTAIESIYVSGTQATVSFTNIPNTYTDLVVRYSARSTVSDTQDTIYIDFNNSGGTFYSYTEIQGSSSGVSASTSSNLSAVQTFGPLGATAIANAFSTGEVYIPNYKFADAKPFGWDTTNARYSSSERIHIVSGRWNDGSTITTIRFDLASGSFAANSNFHLYGIKKD